MLGGILFRPSIGLLDIQTESLALLSQPNRKPSTSKGTEQIYEAFSSSGRNSRQPFLPNCFSPITIIGMNAMATIDMIDSKEAAEILDITPQLVARYCREGRLGQKVGTRWIIFRHEIDQFQKIPRKRGRKPHSERNAK